ncbi:MAG: ATP-NAD kinase family protein [Roseinatronobacter sp.]
MRLGVIINPVAGLGGAVGLKGTDGYDIVTEAIRRGAKPQSGLRARRAFEILERAHPGLTVLVGPGQSGADWLAGINLDVQVLSSVPPLLGTGADTRGLVKAMCGLVDLIVFAGGDGTARDVLASAPSLPMLGIPCGVKMHSGVFALSPSSAGHLLADLVALGPGRIRMSEAEIMDIDEAALRAGHIAPRLYGFASVPSRPRRMQASKGQPGPRDDQEALALAAREMVVGLSAETVLIVGPGRSAGQVMSALGYAPSLLGVDAVTQDQLLARDASAETLKELLEGASEARLVLGVTGQQGFLLGRGNQQINADVIRAAGGRGALEIFATRAKLAALAQSCLWVDTGSASLDRSLTGYVRVRTGPGETQMIRINAA